MEYRVASCDTVLFEIVDDRGVSHVSRLIGPVRVEKVEIGKRWGVRRRHGMFRVTEKRVPVGSSIKGAELPWSNDVKQSDPTAVPQRCVWATDFVVRQKVVKTLLKTTAACDPSVVNECPCPIAVFAKLFRQGRVCGSKRVKECSRTVLQWSGSSKQARDSL